jgi:hypothetical protein
MRGKKILQGIFKQHGAVVVKIAEISTEDIEIEWQTYDQLKKAGAPLANFVEYLCYFRCSDSITRVVQESAKGDPDDGICRSESEGRPMMQVLVMEYVRGSSMKNHEWDMASDDSLRSCILQVLFAVVDANAICGFVHGDLHMDNVIVQVRTGPKGPPGPKGLIEPSIDLEYKHIPKIYVDLATRGGLVAKIMDLEFSRVDGGRRHANPRLGLFKDLLEFFNKAMTSLRVHLVTTDPLYECYKLSGKYVDSPPQQDDNRFLGVMVNAIQRLELRRVMGGDRAGTVDGVSKRHRPYLSKRGGIW